MNDTSDIFSTMRVGKKIRELRIRRNMTQMALADALNVSYQAVSNWERGQSMPDISKLGELSALLECTIDELLGNHTKEAALVQEVAAMEKTGEAPAQAPDPEALVHVAPILKPTQTAALAHKLLEEAAENADAPEADATEEENGPNGRSAETIHILTSLAPFLDDELLDEMVEKLLQDGRDVDTHAAVGLAPFLSDKTLDRLAGHLQAADGLTALAGLAPFLSEEAINVAVLRAADGDAPVTVAQFSVLGPFLPKQTMQRLAENLPLSDLPSLTALAPFLDKQALHTLVERVVQSDGDLKNVRGLAPFLDKSALRTVFEAALARDDTKTLRDISPFL